MATWIFLRHGESVANAGNWLAGHVDTPLTERGRAQAEAAGRTLASFPLGRVVSSDLRRAVNTARIALSAWARARGEPAPVLEQRVALRERNTGTWAYRDRSELRRSGLMARLTSWDLGPPEGESQAMLAARVLPALAELEAQAQAEDSGAPILVVAHGGVLRVTMCALDDTPRDQVGFFGVANAEPIVRQVSANVFGTLARAITSEMV